MAQSNGQQVVEAPHLLKSIMLKDEDITRYSIRGATQNRTPNNYSNSRGELESSREELAYC